MTNRPGKSDRPTVAQQHLIWKRQPSISISQGGGATAHYGSQHFEVLPRRSSSSSIILRRWVIG